MNDLSKVEGLDWLVGARNEIQTFMLNLYKHLPKSGQSDLSFPNTSVDWHLFVGAAFSLWRAVFLVAPNDVSRTTNELADHVADFLKKVIKTNAIAFGDEFRERSWSSGYYLNNARYRVKALMGRHSDIDMSEVLSDAVLKDLWNETFAELQKALERAVA